MMRTSKLISLRQWIKGALNSAGSPSRDSSSAYLAASLTVALSLTEQISQAEALESLGVSRELELLPTGDVRDWAEFVWIRLRTSEGRDARRDFHAASDNCQRGGSWTEDELRNQPLPCETFTSDNMAASLEGIHQQLDAFLESFDFDQFEAAEDAAQHQHHPAGLTPVSCAINSSESKHLNSLDVDSACIRYPESEPNDFFSTDPHASKQKLQRIYSLGLVFYELFSGGELPPPELVALGSSDGAFMSLPTLTLTEKGNTDQGWNSAKRRQDPSGSCKGVGLCQLSSEYLKLMGLPGPLCHLIFNMLDCVYGDFSGDDCYTQMVDVASDLRLMIDKPDKFLRDLDLEKLYISGLQLKEAVLSREDELASIKSSYHRCVSESYEIAIITGESGTGKSWLAHCVRESVAGQGGLFLTGKFDQMMQVSPFFALASAFDQYCDLLIDEKESEWATQIVNKLNVALGRDACHLITVIPKLKHILSCDSSFAESSSDQNCPNALQRLHYLLCQFVEVISTFSDVSVTLFLDDVQWADATSISVLNRLLLKRNKKFFFLGCYRGVEMEDDHPFWVMIKNVRALGIKTTVVKLRCMEKDTLNQMVSDLLHLPPRVVRSLSDVIYTKTKGNPLFFFQLMLSLNQDGLLRLSLSRRRWVWDIEEILSMKLPDDVALCFANGISKLPLEVQSALRILSMFGASTKCDYMMALESQLDLKLIEPLNVAITEGLVSNLKGSFHFCHDRLQEVSYDLMEVQDRSRDHLRFGLCLVKRSLDTSDYNMLLTAVNQINFGGPSAVSDAKECASMANYNLMAGKKAMEMSDFLSAYSFFSFGIGFLPNGHWTEHYHLSLELFDLASKSALATGNIDSLRIRSNEVIKNARSFEDKLNTYFIIMSSLAYASKVSEALEKGHKILFRLGESIPSNPTKEELDQHIQRTQSLMRGVSETDILNFRLMTDNTKLVAMKFLAQLEVITFIVNPYLHPFVTLKMVQLTMLYGLSPVSPIGFVYFGSLLAKRGSIQVGHRFTLLAKALIERLKAREGAGEVICVATEVLCFLEPVQTACKLLVTQGESAAMADGDIHWACLNRLEYCCMMFWSCPTLSVVNDLFSETCQFMKEHQHRTCLYFLLPIQKAITTMMGNETEHLTDNELSRSISENKNPRHLTVLSFYKMYRSFMLDNGMLKECAETFFQLKTNSWLLYFGDSAQALIIGLVAFHIYRESRDFVWLERGKMCLEEMKLWVEQGSRWNFHHKLLLLQAEELYSSGSFENARVSYVNAIEYAKLHKFINDEALACELAAKFYLGTNNLALSLDHFRLAQENYLKWGAPAKANRLFAFTNETFRDVFGDRSGFLSKHCL